MSTVLHSAILRAARTAYFRGCNRNGLSRRQWALCFPATPVLIDGQKRYIRMKFYGRMKVYVLKGRGWRTQGIEGNGENSET